MDPSAIDPIAYTGAGGPVPNGAFLFEGGAVDTNDLLWSKQKQAEQRVIESYAKREERNLLESFRKQQEQVESKDPKLPSPIPHILPPKAIKAPQKKLLSALISVKPAKHALSPTSEAEGSKRARNLSEEPSPAAGAHSSKSESPASHQPSSSAVPSKAATSPAPAGASAPALTGSNASALATLADYSDSGDDT